MTRQAVGSLFMKCEESGSVKGTEQWKTFCQHRTLYCGTCCKHLHQKDAVGHALDGESQASVWSALQLSSIACSELVNCGVAAKATKGCGAWCSHRKAK